MNIIEGNSNSGMTSDFISATPKFPFKKQVVIE